MSKTALTHWTPHYAVRDVLLDDDFPSCVEFHHLVAMRSRLFRERDAAFADEELAYMNEAGCGL